MVDLLRDRAPGGDHGDHADGGDAGRSPRHGGGLRRGGLGRRPGGGGGCSATGSLRATAPDDGADEQEQADDGRDDARDEGSGQAVADAQLGRGSPGLRGQDDDLDGRLLGERDGDGHVLRHLLLVPDV